MIMDDQTTKIIAEFKKIMKFHFMSHHEMYPYVSFFAYCLSNENSNSQVELIRAAPSGICHFA